MLTGKEVCMLYKKLQAVGCRLTRSRSTFSLPRPRDHTISVEERLRFTRFVYLMDVGLVCVRAREEIGGPVSGCVSARAMLPLQQIA